MTNWFTKFLNPPVSSCTAQYLEEAELTAKTTGAAAAMIGAVGPALGSSPTKFPGNPISKS